MKGIVFNLLEEVVVAAHGQDAWDGLIEAADVSGAYTSLGSYDDAEIEALVAAASTALGLPRSAVLRWFGQQAMPLLVRAYPGFFERHTSARPFVMGVNHIIHAEVRKLYAGAGCPHFDINQDEAGDLAMGYRSSRRMCALAQGFMEGAAAHYCEAVEVEHATCVEHGDAACQLKVRWLS